MRVERSAKSTPGSVVVPDLDLPGRAIVLSLWHRRRGDWVERGTPVVELVAGEVAVDLPAPASGFLVEKSAAEEQAVEVGQVLGRIEARNSEFPATDC